MRVVFATDIHIGADAAGYQMQPRWIEGIDRVLNAFASRVNQLRPDLVIIGGDTVERGTPELIEQATGFLSTIESQVLMCLGNHDLTEPDSYELWRGACSQLPHVRLSEATVRCGECDVVGLNTWWMYEGKPALRWLLGTPPLAIIPEGQQRWLDNELAAADRPAIVVMHSQIAGVPAHQSGQPNDFEPPAAPFADDVRAVLKRHPRVQLVLGGHCHIQCSQRVGGPVACTGTSLTEVPFQFTIIERSCESFTLRTEQLSIAGAPPVKAERSWVLGLNAPTLPG